MAHQPTDGRRDRATDGSVSYRRLITFFLPLAATPFLISMTHNIINATLARLPSPELTLAVFTVVKSFSNAIKAPVLVSGQVSTALADSRQSYRVSTGFVWSVAGGFFLILVALGYTPLGGLFLRAVMGLEDPEAIDVGYRAMRITAFLPLTEVTRDSNRGILIARQRTTFVSVGTAARLVAILMFVVWAVRSRTDAGIEVAALTWTGGLAIEALVVLGALFILFGSPIRAAEGVPRRNDRTVTIRYVAAFFLPLAFMITVRAALQPLVQAGIARGAESATRALAVYGVSWGLVLNILAPLVLLHNVAMVFAPGRKDPSWPIVARFCAATGAAMTGILLVLGLTPAGVFLLRRVLGVSAQIAAESNQAVLAFCLLPLFWSTREAYWGVMMRRHRTGGIAVGKAVNVAAMTLAMVLLFGPLGGLVTIPPSVVGAVSLTVGEAVETAVVISAARREERKAAETSGT